MPTILKQFLELLLFRGHPGDLPGTSKWLLITAVAATLVNTLVSPGFVLMVASALMTVVFGALIWILLKTMDRSERWIQTMTGIYGVSTIIYIVSTPVRRSLHQLLVEIGFAAVATGPFILSGILTLWLWLVTAHILRQATEMSFGKSFLVVFLFVFITELFVGLFMPGIVPMPEGEHLSGGSF